MCARKLRKKRAYAAVWKNPGCVFCDAKYNPRYHAQNEIGTPPSANTTAKNQSPKVYPYPPPMSANVRTRTFQR
jgi:hypothetical protein